MSGAIGIGLIGCGMIGQGHAYALRLLAEDGEVRPVAAADLSRRRRASAPSASARSNASAPTRTRSSTIPTSTRSRSSTPTTTHLDLVRATLAAGKPLLCEKPLATDFATVREMCDARRGGRHHRAGRLPLAVPSGDQRAACRRREQRARSPDGLRAARRPVLADRRRRARAQLVALGSRARGRRRAARALDPQRRHPVLAVRTGRARLRAHAQRVRLRRRGRRCVHGRARVRGSSARCSRSSTACAGARSAASRCSSSTARSRSRPTSSSARPKTASSSSGPTRRRAAARHGRVARAALRRRRHRAARLHGLPVSGGAGVRARRCGTGRPASPGFADALRAHALVEAAYRSAAGGQPVD